MSKINQIKVCIIIVLLGIIVATCGFSGKKLWEIYYPEQIVEEETSSIEEVVEFNENKYAIEHAIYDMEKYLSNITINDYFSDKDIEELATMTASQMAKDKHIRQEEAEVIVGLIKEELKDVDLTTSLLLTDTTKKYLTLYKDLTSMELIAKIDNDIKNKEFELNFELSETSINNIKSQVKNSVAVNQKISDYAKEHEIGITSDEIADIMANNIASGVADGTIATSAIREGIIKRLTDDAVAEIALEEPEVVRIEEETALTLEYVESQMQIMQSMIDAATVSIDELSSSEYVGELILTYAYPVGSVYVSQDPTSPETLFGGTWEPVKDRMLLSAGNTYTGGAEDGTLSKPLNAQEIPTLQGIVDATTSTLSGFIHYGYDKTYNYVSSIGVLDTGYKIVDNPLTGTAAGLWGGTPVTTYGFTDIYEGSVDVSETILEVFETPTSIGSLNPKHVNFANPYITSYIWVRTN